jgi:predicted DNA-binding transcriptional regulator AlpA
MKSTKKKGAAAEKVGAKARSKKAALSPHLAAANIAHIAKAALAADRGHDQHDRRRAHGARAPPLAVPLGKEVQRARARTSVPVQLYARHEIVAIVGLSFPSIWKMMRAGTFPRGLTVGGVSKWRSDEVQAWLDNLEVRTLKGDLEAEAVA